MRYGSNSESALPPVPSEAFLRGAELGGGVKLQVPSYV